MSSTLDRALVPLSVLQVPKESFHNQVQSNQDLSSNEYLSYLLDHHERVEECVEVREEEL